MTDWMVIGGPIIGFHFVKHDEYDFIDKFSVLVGDECRPKYMGARRLILEVSRKDEVNFFWQQSYYNYLQKCAKHGTFSITDPVQLAWISIAQNTAVLEPRVDRILTGRASIAIDYRLSTRNLPLLIK